MPVKEGLTMQITFSNRYPSGGSHMMAVWLCITLLLASCGPLRDRSVVKKETAEAAAALGLTPADMLWAGDSTIDLGKFIYSEYYITTTIPITSIEAVLKPVGYGTAGYSGSGAFNTLERLSQGRLKSVGTNPRQLRKFEGGVEWLKSRGQGSWTVVETHLSENQQKYFEYDGKLLTGTLVILQATYR
jgi:hypothetical protein